MVVVEMDAESKASGVMTPTTGRLRWKIEKNRHLIDSFLLRRAPEFVYRRQPRALGREIPVFTFHAAIPELFEQACEFLVRNGYRTLSGAELRRCLLGEEQCSNAVVLTFDDGLKQVWSVAHPILEKHGLQGVCFLVPGCIPERDDRVRPTMADVWSGAASEADVVGIRSGEPPLCTWPEIRRMQAAGTFEFHSHTMYHALVPVSDRVFAFASPSYDPYLFGNVHIPLYERGGRVEYGRDPHPGLPIFYASSRMCAHRRFIPDGDLIERCIESVAREGAPAFFERPDWRRRLRAVVADYARRRGALGRYETQAERDRAVRDDLASSRQAIEARLPGVRVDQLCFPWFAGGRFAIEAAHAVGYVMSHFGEVRGRWTNWPGQDPSAVARIDELYLERLPGAGRMTLRALARRMFELRSVSARLRPDRADRPTVSVAA